MDGKISKKVPKFLFYYINKALRGSVEGIFVNDPGLQKLRKLIDQKSQIILMPVYKSFLDFPILLYSLLVNKIDLPFTIGNQEDIPDVKLLDTILRKCGYITSKRSRN